MQLAHAADKADVRVLAVDLDPQANLSQVLMGAKDYVAHLPRAVSPPWITFSMAMWNPAPRDGVARKRSRQSR